MAAIYLDNAATTPLDERVAETMRAFLEAETFGNPSSTHAYGRAARAHLERSREVVAAAIGAEPAEIVFTAGGTEADFLALTGILMASGRKGLVTSAIEHHAVLHSAEWLQDLGYDVTFVRPDDLGIVPVLDVVNKSGAQTGLVSVMWVNNETGARQPIEELAVQLAKRGIAFHTDAVQAMPTLPIDVRRLAVSSLSISGHKIAGPKGVGALYLRKGTPFRSPLRGGSQERGRRAGTENLAGIVGLTRAIELWAQEREQRAAHIGALRERFVRALTESIPGTLFHPAPQQAEQIVHVAWPGILAQTVLMNLDLAGIAASGGSACTAGAVEPSHVLLAQGWTEDRAKASLRFSFSARNTMAEVDETVVQLSEVIARLRRRL